MLGEIECVRNGSQAYLVLNAVERVRSDSRVATSSDQPFFATTALGSLQVSSSLSRRHGNIVVWGICGSFPLHRDRRLGEGRTAGGRRVREARSRMPGRALSGLSVGYLIPPTDWHPRGQVLSAVGNNLWILGPGRPVDYYKRRSLHALLSVFIAGGTI